MFIDNIFYRTSLIFFFFYLSLFYYILIHNFSFVETESFLYLIYQFVVNVLYVL